MLHRLILLIKSINTAGVNDEMVSKASVTAIWQCSLRWLRQQRRELKFHGLRSSSNGGK